MVPFIGFLRIRDWWYLNGLFIVGFFYSGAKGPWVRDLLLGLIISSFYLLHGYSLNEYFDRKARCQADKDGNLGPGYLRLSLAIFIFNILFSVLVAPTLATGILVGGILSWIYSAPPWYLKRHAFGRLFLNAAGFSLLFFMGAIFQSPMSFEKFLFFLSLVLLFIPIELFHNLNDMSSDQRDGIITLPLRHGIPFSGNVLSLSLVIFGGYASVLFAAQYLSRTVFLLDVALGVALFLLNKAALNSKRHRAELSGIKANARLILSVYGILLFVVFLIRW